MNRRAFLTGLLCAPAIVRASSLMAIKPLPEGGIWETWLGETKVVELSGLTPIFVSPAQLSEMHRLYGAAMIDDSLARAGFKAQVCQDAILWTGRQWPGGS